MGVNNPLSGIPARDYPTWAAARFQQHAQTRGRRVRANNFQRTAGADLLQLRAMQARVQQAQQQEQDASTFGIGGLISGTGNLLGGVFETLQRGDQLVSGAALAAVEGRDPIQGGIEAFKDPQDDINFATVFERLGMGETERNVLGLVADMALSPWNLLGIGAVKTGIKSVGRAGVQVSHVDRLFRPGRIGDRAAGWIGTKLARTFQTDILGDTSPYELTRNLRALGVSKEAAESWIRDVRVSRNMAQHGQQQAVNDVITGIHMHTKREVMSLGNDEATAQRMADEFIDKLKNDEEFSKKMFTVFDEMSQQGIEFDNAIARVSNLGPEAASQISLMEQAGMAGALRFMRSQFGRLDDGNWGEIAALKEQYLGVTPRQAVYIRRWFPDTEELSKALEMDPKLREQVSPSAYKRIMDGPLSGTQEAIDAGLHTNLVEVLAYDISTARLGSAMNKVIDVKALRGMGGRQVRLNAQETGLAQIRLRQAGVDPTEVQRLMKSGDQLEDLYAKLGRGDTAIEADLRNLWESLPRQGEDFYNPNITFMHLDPEQAQVLARELGENWGDDVAAGTGLQVHRGQKTATATVKGKAQQQWIIPEEMARGLNNWKNPAQQSGIMGVLDVFNGMFKPFVTVFWPAFFVRNAEGLVHNMWFSGMGGRDILENTLHAGFVQKGSEGGVVKMINGQKMVEIPTPEGPLNMTYNEFVSRLELDGALNVGARDVGVQRVTSEGALEETSTLKRLAAMIKGEKLEKREGMEMFKELVRTHDQSIRQQHGKNLAGYGASLNQAMDNNAKIARVLYGLKKGETWEEAVGNSRKFLFDYSEAGRGVQGAGVQFFPFLRWARFSTPLMAEQMFAQPQKIQKLGVLTRSVGGGGKPKNDIDDADATLEAEASTLPDWLMEKYHILLGRNEDGSQRVIYGLGLPIEDLNRIFAGGLAGTVENWVSEVTPIIRAPIELAADHSFFVGEPLGRKDPKMARFYARTWGWIDGMPSPAGDKLREWLQLDRIEDPRTGSVRYRAGNPVNMYMFANIVMRAGSEGEKVRRIFADDRDRGMNIVNFMTGVKVGDFFDPAPSRVPLAEALQQNPFLRQKHALYMDIPIYPQFNDATQSQAAVQAMSGINSYRGFLRRAFPDATEDQLFNHAASKYGENDPQGEILARLIQSRGWKPLGSRVRNDFLSLPENIDLAAAVAQLDPITAEQLRGTFLD
jgi:hypothetical protein